MVDFKTLLALAAEIDEPESILWTIEYLAHHDMAMTDAVIALGVAYGVLKKGYKNGWSKKENMD